MQKIGRNDPCYCGSGKKYKKCCELKEKHKKFHAEVLSGGTEEAATTEAKKIASLFFTRAHPPAAPKPETPPEPKNPVM